MVHSVDFPFDATLLLRKKRSLKRELSEQDGLQPLRVALLGGSTTAEIKDILELFLLRAGFKTEFYECDFGRWLEESIFENKALESFAPQFVIILTASHNILAWPAAGDSAAAVEAKVEEEVSRFRQCWEALTKRYGCMIIQNNFELPPTRLYGNMDAWDPRGRTSFVRELNRRFAAEARGRKRLLLNDLEYLAADFGLERWHDRKAWFLYKYAQALEAVPFLSYSLACLIKAAMGRSSKALVLDLDNTLWGGVVGDDGPTGIQIGQNGGEAEAFSEFQRHVLDQKSRGVLLAVASKNDMERALEGLRHPDASVRPGDLVSLKANWEPKSENLKAMAQELQLGLDSFVFVDDNPAERALVRAQLPLVQVPEIGGEVDRYSRLLDRAGYFETVSMSSEDLARTALYAQNAQRESGSSKFEDYDAYLRSLEMVAEVKPFNRAYLDRITQLCNKTNQFNLTTRRYSEAEIEALIDDPEAVSLYGKLKDRFGDNGLVSLVAGNIRDGALHLDLWLMSCRVLKRGLEHAMFEALLFEAGRRDLHSIVGVYRPTPKNGMVRDHYKDLGFKLEKEVDDGSSIWRLDKELFQARKHSIKWEEQ
jgi:FkbH-like protein